MGRGRWVEAGVAGSPSRTQYGPLADEPDLICGRMRPPADAEARIVGQLKQPMHRRGAIQSVVAAALAGASLAGGLTRPAAAGHPWGPVRNLDPQPATNPVHEQRPIHYPGQTTRTRDVRGSGDAVDGLLADFFDLHTTMNYERAAAVAERLVQMAPDRAELHYNLACTMGRLHRADEALASLERAVECGWRDVVHLSIDPDLDAIRSTPRYEAITQRLKTVIATEHEAAPTRQREGWRPQRLQRDVPPILARYGVPETTIALVNGGRIAWIGSFDDRGRVVAAATERPVEAGSCLRLLALAAVLRHEAACGGVVTRQVAPTVGSSPDEAPSVAEIVESMTQEPFVPCCRRHVITPLAMTDTTLARGAAAGGLGFAFRTTAADLARLLSALTDPPSASLPPDRAADAARLARRLGFTTAAGRRGELQLAHRSDGEPDAADVIVRWQPRSGRAAVVVTNGRDGGRAAGRIAGLAVGDDTQGIAVSGHTGVN